MLTRGGGGGGGGGLLGGGGGDLLRLGSLAGWRPARPSIAESYA
eukprot:COSAG02_NODE_677_length_18591_cov_105.949221_5_plen_44_part_00